MAKIEQKVKANPLPFWSILAIFSTFKKLKKWRKSICPVTPLVRVRARAGVRSGSGLAGLKLRIIMNLSSFIIMNLGCENALFD